MRPDIRAAAIGGLAATLVVAASLAPKLLADDQDGQTFRAAADTAELADAPTTTTAPPPAAAIEEMAPTTSPAPSAPATTGPAREEPTTTDRVTRVEEKVDNIGQRVTTLEQQATTTTTTTTTRPPAPSGGPGGPIGGSGPGSGTTVTTAAPTTTTTVRVFSCTVSTIYSQYFRSQAILVDTDEAQPVTISMGFHRPGAAPSPHDAYTARTEAGLASIAIPAEWVEAGAVTVTGPGVGSCSTDW